MTPRHAAIPDPALPGIQAVAATGIAAFIAAHGAAAGRVFATAGLAPDTFAHPHHRLPLVAYCDLFEQAARQTGIDTFGLRFGLARATDALGEVGDLALTAPTLAAALAALCRFFPALQEHSSLTLHREGALVRLDYQIRDGRIVQRRQDAELTIGVLVALLRRVLGASWAPEAIEFEHVRPAGRAGVETLLGAPVGFSAAANTVIFRATALAAPMPAPDLRRAGALEARLAHEAAAARPDDLVGEVRQQIRAALVAGTVGLAPIARRQGMSEPSLYRALRSRGVEFSELVRALRRELALGYLAEPHLSLTEIALLLGYSELSAFSRAFRAWTGLSPAAWRRRLDA
ncbi:MAG: AraC family transcriptional regulator [Proteobacteria bacterium]|nr:AraC family transcriptional regulator [Pseudomonadota bacterium]